jgi:hypothetical protein
MSLCLLWRSGHERKKKSKSRQLGAHNLTEKDFAFLGLQDIWVSASATAKSIIKRRSAEAGSASSDDAPLSRQGIMHHLFERLRSILDVGWKDVTKDSAYRGLEDTSENQEKSALDADDEIFVQELVKLLSQRVFEDFFGGSLAVNTLTGIWATVASYLSAFIAHAGFRVAGTERDTSGLFRDHIKRGC